MAYTWLGMQKLTWEEVKNLHKKGELSECYKLYDDGTEGQITDDYT